MIHGQTVQEQAEALAKSGRVAKASGMFRYLGNMLYKGEEVLLARKIFADIQKAKADVREEKNRNAQEELVEAAAEVYQKYIANPNAKLTKKDLQTIVKFVVPLEGKDDAKCPSKHFKNIDTLMLRLSQCDRPWYKYLAPNDDEEESKSGEESESEENSVQNESEQQAD
jgi:hypothetical protein